MVGGGVSTGGGVGVTTGTSSGWNRGVADAAGTALLRDPFGHHVWATLALIDACAPLTSEQFATTVPGTYGSIINTIATASTVTTATPVTVGQITFSSPYGFTLGGAGSLTLDVAGGSAAINVNAGTNHSSGLEFKLEQRKPSG